MKNCSDVSLTLTYICKDKLALLAVFLICLVHVGFTLMHNLVSNEESRCIASKVGV